MDTIGKRIKFARRKKNLTLTEIKNLTGLSTGNLSELENDKFMPSANALISLSAVLDVSIDWLLKGENALTYIDKDLIKESIPRHEEYQINNDDIKSLSQEENYLINSYRKLDDDQRRNIIGFMEVSIKLKDEKNSG